MFNHKQKRELATIQDHLMKEIREIENNIYGQSRYQFTTTTEALEHLLSLKEVQTHFYSDLMDNFPSAVAIIDKQCNIIAANAMLHNFLDITDRDVANKPSIESLVSRGDDACELCQFIENVIYVEKKSTFSAEGVIYISTKKEQHIPIFVFVIPVYKNGELQHSCIILRDRRTEFEIRRKFMLKQSSPIIHMIEEIAKGNISQKLKLPSEHQLPHYQEPINHIVDSLTDIVLRIQEAIKDSQNISDQTHIHLNNLTNWSSTQFIPTLSSISKNANQLSDSILQISLKM